MARYLEDLPRDITLEQIQLEIQKTMQRDAELQTELDALLASRADMEGKLQVCVRFIREFLSAKLILSHAS
jgi:hypothetical protein